MVVLIKMYQSDDWGLLVKSLIYIWEGRTYEKSNAYCAWSGLPVGVRWLCAVTSQL